MDFARLDGASVTNQDEEKLGKVAGLFVDDTSGVPTWVSVTSGLFGAHHYLLPLAESRFDGEVLWVPYSKDDLAAAPPHDPVWQSAGNQQWRRPYRRPGTGTSSCL